ncbi:hypothetical protein HPB50_016206 [Hyalomma asiaticum]|uniref:Uncharacterized protein n=1 Tax=Hyalomma asiaticum TaxID=266040 RepID=A0ACB7T888_HYAAI|nr:hypothetical protein HPB50_016206 [Hyalomma asiaticum]
MERGTLATTAPPNCFAGRATTPLRIALLRHVFNQRLFEPIRFVLATADNVNLDSLAQLADNVPEVTSPSIGDVLLLTDMQFYALSLALTNLPLHSPHAGAPCRTPFASPPS